MQIIGTLQLFPLLATRSNFQRHFQVETSVTYWSKFIKKFPACGLGQKLVSTLIWSFIALCCCIKKHKRTLFSNSFTVNLKMCLKMCWLSWQQRKLPVNAPPCFTSVGTRDLLWTHSLDKELARHSRSINSPATSGRRRQVTEAKNLNCGRNMNVTSPW